MVTLGSHASLYAGVKVEGNRAWAGAGVRVSGSSRYAGASCDPKGSMAFLQNNFRCPPMLGAPGT